MKHFVPNAVMAIAVTGAYLTPAMADVVPVSLDPINHQRAELVVVQSDGSEVRYTPESLEALPTYSMTTKSPWREIPAVFDGVLLSDILSANGLSDVAEIRVTAENDFTTTVTREAWSEVPILVATRVDGQAHSRRERGPIQFIIDYDTYKASDLIEERHFVWMASKIEAID